MLHFIARKFARVYSKVCTDEGHGCSRSTSMIAQLKNSSSVCSVLLDSNESHLRDRLEDILNCHVSIIDSNSVLKKRSSELYLVFTRGCCMLMIVSNVFKIATLNSSSSSF